MLKEYCTNTPSCFLYIEYHKHITMLEVNKQHHCISHRHIDGHSFAVHEISREISRQLSRESDFEIRAEISREISRQLQRESDMQGKFVLGARSRERFGLGARSRVGTTTSTRFFFGENLARDLARELARDSIAREPHHTLMTERCSI